MAYRSSTERVADIRAELKKEFPDFKFSIVKDGYNGVRIGILAGPVNMMEGETETYVSVNHYYIDEHYKDNPEVRDILKKIYNIASRGVEYRETGDYGTQPDFYVYITIGAYNKPFEYTPKKTRSAKAPQSSSSSPSGRWDKGELLRECAGWKVYKKTLPDGRVVYNAIKDKDTPPNKGDWNAIKGEIYTESGFKWGRFGAFEKWGEMSTNDANLLLDRMCSVLSKYYTSSTTPSAPTPMPSEGNLKIQTIVAETLWSDGLKEMMIDDFIKSNYEIVNGLIGKDAQETSKNIQKNILGFPSGKHTYLQANMLAEIIHSKLQDTTPEQQNKVTIYINGAFYETAPSQMDATLFLGARYGGAKYNEMLQEGRITFDNVSNRVDVLEGDFFQYGRTWGVPTDYGKELMQQLIYRGFKIYYSTPKKVLVIFKTDMGVDGVMIVDNGGEFNLERYGYNEFITSINYELDKTPASVVSLSGLIADIYDDYFANKKEEPKQQTSKEDLQKAIAGLQILASKGNEKARKAIIGLQILLNK